MIEMDNTRSRYLYRDGSGKQHVRAELTCDTCAELAGVTTLDGGNILLSFGSMALAAEGEVCMLDSSGVWHRLSDGSAVGAEEVSGGE